MFEALMLAEVTKSGKLYTSFCFHQISGGILCLPSYYNPLANEVRLVIRPINFTIKAGSYHHLIQMELTPDFKRVLVLLGGLVETMGKRTIYPSDFARALLSLIFTEVDFITSTDSIPIQQLLEL